MNELASQINQVGFQNFSKPLQKSILAEAKNLQANAPTDNVEKQSYVFSNLSPNLKMAIQHEFNIKSQANPITGNPSYADTNNINYESKPMGTGVTTVVTRPVNLSLDQVKQLGGLTDYEKGNLESTLKYQTPEQQAQTIKDISRYIHNRAYDKLTSYNVQNVGGGTTKKKTGGGGTAMVTETITQPVVTEPMGGKAGDITDPSFGTPTTPTTYTGSGYTAIDKLKPLLQSFVGRLFSKSTGQTQSPISNVPKPNVANEFLNTIGSNLNLTK